MRLPLSLLGLPLNWSSQFSSSGSIELHGVQFCHKQSNYPFFLIVGFWTLFVALGLVLLGLGFFSTILVL